MIEMDKPLSQLPKGWVWSPLGEIVSFEYGRGLREDRRDSSGNVPVFGSNGIVGHHSHALVFEPCLIIGRKGAAGTVHISKTSCWPIDTTYYVIPPKGIDLTFLYHLISSLRLVCLDKSTAIPGLNRNDAYTLNVPIPPTQEQQRIVAKIEELFTDLDAGVEALQRAKTLFKRYRQSVLKAAVTGELTKVWREAHKGEIESAKVLLERYGKKPSENNDLPKLPEGWCWTSVDQLANHRLGKMLDKEKNKGVPRPYLRNINVRWFGFDLSDIQYMRVMDEELDNISIRQGDLVICEGGEPGRAAVWIRDDSTIIQKALHRVRPFGAVLSQYLNYCLAADANSGRLGKYFTGSTIKHFTGESLHSYPIPLPPLAEQRCIWAEVEQHLSVAGKLEMAIEGEIVRGARLRQSILKRAFEGKLVPQDPKDEPASVLLERIRSTYKKDPLQIKIDL